MVDLRQFDKGVIKTGNSEGTTPQRLRTTSDGPAKTTQLDDTTRESKELESDAVESHDKQIAEFREALKEKGVTDEQILSALDALITKGSFEWEFKLFGKVECAFRVRPQWVEQLVIDRLEELSPKTYARFTSTLNLYNLAGSLARYGNTAFNPNSVDELGTVIDHVSNLPNVVIKRLITQLVTFDQIMAVATSTWAIENFS